MKTTIGLIATFIFVYLIFVVTQVPANIALGWFKLPSNVNVGQVSGSVWNTELSGVEVNGFAVNNVKTSLSPLSLLTLSPALDATFGGNLSAGPQGVASARLSSNSQTLTDTQVMMAAADIVPYLPVPIPVEAFGQVTLNIEQLEIVEGKCVQAVGTIAWQGAALIALEQEIELGSFNGSLSCQGDRFALALDTNNRLGLSYTASIDLNGRLRGNGYIQPGANFPAQLREALPFIGRPDNQGRYQLKL